MLFYFVSLLYFFMMMQNSLKTPRYPIPPEWDFYTLFAVDVSE